jgi:hypothetical protein
VSPTQSTLSPTDEQIEIIEATTSASASLMISAYAGCAKTTSLQLLGEKIRTPALALAFNKSIAKELEGRFPSNFKVQTLNGFGFGALRRALPQVDKWTLDDRKVGRLVTEHAKAAKIDLGGEDWDLVRRLVSGAQNTGLLPNGGGVDEGAWSAIATDLWLPAELHHIHLADGVLRENNELVRKGTISFDDQIYWPTVHDEAKFPQYPRVLLDEAQDMTLLNHRMIAKATGANTLLYACGDSRQCHPIGTMIQLTGGKSIPIENIQVGAQVVSYNRKVGFSGVKAQGRKVTAVNTFPFKGNLIRINTEGFFSHDCTPEHKCMVRWDDKSVWCIYLMRRGNQFRVGISKAFYASAGGQDFGPAMRARQEHADDIWVLEVAKDKEAATIREKVLWTQFGLPDLIFENSGKLSSTQTHLNEAWAQIGDNTNRGLNCLKYFSLDIRFPLWSKYQDKQAPIGERTFITQACNLISGVMKVKVFDGTNECPSWSTIWIDHIPYNGLVIGITVESNGFGLNLYVANGIVTHNSIYGFRGAHSHSMEQIRKLRTQWLDRPLTLTFRCPKAIVARQQGHAPGYRAWPTNADGRVASWPDAVQRQRADLNDRFSWNWGDVEAQRPHPAASLAVLCRNNAPLFSLAFKLLRQGIAITMLGRDLGKGLKALVSKLSKDDTPITKFMHKLVDWLVTECELARLNQKEAQAESAQDRHDCLVAIADGAQSKSSEDLKRAIDKVFERERGLVTLASVHKSKGLEWDCVLHLDPWRVPSKMALRSAAKGDGRPLEQEWNLKYVCETRTKHTLIEADLRDFEGSE